MATLALAAIGASAGSTLLPSGIGFLGATLSGGTIGSQIGALGGAFVDQVLFGTSGQATSRTVAGPRLAGVHVTGSREGAPIPRLYGRARVGGQVIWADAIREEAVTSNSGGGGGKGQRRAGGGAAVQTIEYRYYASFAVALTEGEIGGLGRVWADGAEIDLTQVAHRLHTGIETQAADPLIVSRLGADAAPAFRGTAYVVFEEMALAPFGNRVPQLSFEVHRPVEPFAGEVRGVVMIPGAGEFVYATEPVDRVLGLGAAVAENVHTRAADTNWAASLDQLAATLPNVGSVSLVVSWFGSDLRAGHCTIRPGVETADKETQPIAWSVAGLTRAGAPVVSEREGRPAYGGTPSDQTVIEAIGDLKARGYDVVLTPFILMDVPESNALVDPYTGAAFQPAYPWRGRITVSPAPGQPGSPDKTGAAAAQVAALVGTASPAHFSVVGGAVVYSGPAEWSLRRMVLHQAFLAVAAGGVSAFVIGSELRGLTQVRSAAGTYPFVTHLAALAADLKSVLGPATKVTYAADWSEYFGHQPADGTGDVYFHLDQLWASSAIDAIGIDLYWPLADWRDGDAHADRLAGARSVYDLEYLSGNVRGGEGFDWYYASEAARATQTRTPITDGAGKPWVFRTKDLAAWWSNAHYNRPGGVESGSPTAWVAQSKPVWFMETGCPAVDRGANQPNVFVDPKSVESALPYFSRGTRDDLMQRRYLRALIQAFDPSSAGYVAGANPVSAVTGQRMVDLGRIHVYAWDARPFPAFPTNTSVWGDGDNWRLGHWLNGRFAAAPLAETVERLLADYDFEAHAAGALNGTVAGYVIDRAMSARDALAPLELAYFFDSIETGPAISFRHRGGEATALALNEDACVEEKPGAALVTATRAQETELPASAKVTYVAAEGDYSPAVAEARRLAGASGRLAQAELPIVLQAERGAEVAEQWLFEAWAARERFSFTLPPSALALEPGDVVAIESASGTRLARVTEIGDRGAREVMALAIDPEVYGGVVATPRDGINGDDVLAGQPAVEMLDLPLIRGDEAPHAGFFAAVQTPWPGAVALLGSPELSGFTLKAVASAAATMGRTLDPLPSGPVGVVDRASRVRVELAAGALASVTTSQLLAGQNIAAVRNGDGDWEVLQFELAELVAPGTYELSRLLRGQAGSEGAMRAPLAAGAPLVVLDAAVTEVGITEAEVGLPLNWRAGPSSRPIGDRSYVAFQHAFRRVGERPLAPVHVRATRSSGDVALSWVRRTRTGGDSWESVEVPLGETSERYEVDVLDGATVKRTLSASTPAATYTAAQQTADFGAPQASLSVRVYQLGASYGRGSAGAAIV